MMPHLITNVRILDGSGREPFAGAVRVEGPRIAEVTAGAAPTVPPGAVVSDGRGACTRAPDAPRPGSSVRRCRHSDILSSSPVWRARSTAARKAQWARAA
jgi:hypothetical protein